jgi:glycosyltransferase involved in cell wall biosynthesis
MKRMLSVVICTYNGEAYLPLQLQSLLEQSRPPDEVVIQDDGSNDQSVTISEQFAGSAPFPVKVHRNESRLGYANNFLDATEKASGDLVAFCDQDDVWLPVKLERCLAFFDEPDLQTVIHSAQLIDGSGARLGVRFPDYPRTRTFDLTQASPWFYPQGFSMVFCRSLITEFSWKDRPISHLEPLPKAHDQWVYFLASAIGKVAVLSDELVLYRQHQKNTCGAVSQDMSSVMRAALTTGSQAYLASAERARDFAQTYRRLAEAHAEKYGPAFQRAARFFDETADIVARRGSMYAERGKLAKLSRLGESVRRGDYRSPQTGRLGAKALMKDIYVALR